MDRWQTLSASLLVATLVVPPAGAAPSSSADDWDCALVEMQGVVTRIERTEAQPAHLALDVAERLGDLVMLRAHAARAATCIPICAASFAIACTSCVATLA